jgi:hypothetical protein
MIHQSVRRMLNAPWRQRVMMDVLAVAMAAVILPRISERAPVATWPGFALTMVISTAVLLSAAWAVIPPRAAARRDVVTARAMEAR